MSGSEYRLNVGAGKTLQLSFDSASEVAANELYIRFGAMPTRGQFDFAFSEPFAPDQEITFPTTNAGSYYILAYGANVSGAPNYSILAEIIPFSLRAIEPALAGNVGPVTWRFAARVLRRIPHFSSLTRMETGSMPIESFPRIPP